MKYIHLWGVKQNNLKNIEVKVPLGHTTVICGPSGSGKSSLAFETLFAEGQRRFIESMSNYARQFLNKAPKPQIEGINNIPPSISIEQKNSIKSSRSTVGTVTEVIDYLRLFYEKIGRSYCPKHHIPTVKSTVTSATDSILSQFIDQRGYLLVPIIPRPKEKKKTVDKSDRKALYAQLIQDGYLRILIPSEESSKKDLNELSDSLKNHRIHELQDPIIKQKGLPTGLFYLVIDRLLFSSDERGRIADSISQAFEASIKYNPQFLSRKAMALSIDGQTFRISEEESCPICDYQPLPVTSALFSFNSPIGACEKCKGFGNILELDEAKIVPNPQIGILKGALHPFTMPSAEDDRKKLIAFCRKNKIDIYSPWSYLPKEHQSLIWEGSSDFLGVKGLFDYLETKKYKMHVRVFISRYRTPHTCPSCKGTRLRNEASLVKISDHSLPQLCSMNIESLDVFFNHLQLSTEQKKIAHEIFNQILNRLNFLIQVGVGYLTLDRETRTLSGGEYQRLILANQLGMGLSQVLYVLDEPTVGLHPRDNDRLISIIQSIKNLGNTLVIVEHDADVISSSDYILEIGPGSGFRGGELVYSGTTNHFLNQSTTSTAEYLRKSSNLGLSKDSRPVSLEKHPFKIKLKGASGHNLKKIDVTFPLNRLVTLTGVSGSGKTTLVTKTLYPALAALLDIDYLPKMNFESITGYESLKNVLMIDQSSIGKSARSSPITYMKTFDIIRSLMASTPEAKSRGYTAGTFSLNVDGGRCPACKGTGFEEIDMMFMDNVIIPCDICDSKKYRSEILEIEYKGKNIFEILKMTVQEAIDFFIENPSIRKPLNILKEVGLDYLQIGQPANSLSGGESQRLKIAKELTTVNQNATLYILDEPTTGLHFNEINLLLNVLNKLIEAGGSVILIEHNLEVIRRSDFIIDLGPEGGDEGGEVVFSGSPKELLKSKKSLTGLYLKKYLNPKVVNKQ